MMSSEKFEGGAVLSIAEGLKKGPEGCCIIH